MLHHVEKLRQKPEHIRRRWAFGVSAGATALIALIWIFSLVASGGPFTFNSPISLAANPSAGDSSPLSAMQASAASALQSLIGSNPFTNSIQPTTSAGQTGLQVVNPNDVTQ